MTREYWTAEEIVSYFEIGKSFLDELEDENIICSVCSLEPSEKTFSREELEKIRLCKLLVEEMDVNLPGVEVILRMRRNMIEMRRQFDEILTSLARELKISLENE